MHRRSLLSLLVPTLAPLAFAGGTEPKTTPTPDTSADSKAFDALDRSIETIAKSLQDTTTTAAGPQIGTLLRTSYENSGDDVFQTAGGDDLGGFRFQDAQVWFYGGLADFDVFIKADAGEAYGFPDGAFGPASADPDGLGTLDIRDAWARTKVTNEVSAYIGQFKCPVAASANVAEDSLIMIDRTRVGQLFSMPGAYQPGVAFVGDYNQLHGKIAIQNGADNVADEYGVVLRGEYKLNDGANHREGALGAEGMDATFGIGYFSDDSQVGGADFGTALILDGYFTMDQFSVHAEIADFDDELAANALGNANDDANPISATFGYRLNEQIEAALRLQDLDNDLDEKLITVGANYYVSGHHAKWQLNFTNYDNDNDDGNLIQLGLTLGASQP